MEVIIETRDDEIIEEMGGGHWQLGWAERQLQKQTKLENVKSVGQRNPRKGTTG
jgi:hypothetical protein